MRPWIVLLVVLFSNIPSTTYADGLFVEGGVGIIHSRLSDAGFLRYYKDTSPVLGLRSFYDFSLAHWNGRNDNDAVAIGRGVLWGWTDEFYSSFEAGGAYLWQTTENLGTRAQFAFRFAFGLKAETFDISAGYIHYSNGQEIFRWSSNRPNKSENFVTIQIGRMF
jgi:hypothetical protein